MEGAPRSVYEKLKFKAEGTLSNKLFPNSNQATSKSTDKPTLPPVNNNPQMSSAGLKTTPVPASLSAIMGPALPPSTTNQEYDHNTNATRRESCA